MEPTMSTTSLRRSSGLLTILALFLLMTLNPARADHAMTGSFAVHKIKAVYIYRLASFIRWQVPEDHVARYCVLGRDSTTVTLQKLLTDKDHLGQFRSVGNLTDASKQCDLLYITAQKLPVLQSIPQYEGLLTISDSPQFLALGGMIELRAVGQQIKPVLSPHHLEKGRLSVKSQLLRIALLDDAYPVAQGGQHEKMD